MAKKNNKKIHHKKKNGKWTKCPECGVKVRPRNLENHIMRVHTGFFKTPKGRASIAISVFAIAVVFMLVLTNFNLIGGTPRDNIDSNNQNTSLGDDDIVNPKPERTNHFKRTVFVETFTSVDCYWCNAEEEPALKQIAADYQSNEVVIVAYHGFYGNDPYETAKGNTRADYYGGISGTPSVWFDGTVNKRGGTGNGVEAMYNVYDEIIDERGPLFAPVTIMTSGSISGSKVQISVDLSREGNIDTSDLYLRMALIENDIQYNGKSFHWVVRDLSEVSISSETFPIGLKETFQLENGWNTDNLNAVVWVQDDSDKEVMQSSLLEL